MKAVPAAAVGEAGSWKRSSQADSAEGEGVARSRSRRHRVFDARRSARDSKSFSIARRIAENPPSRSNRSMSSTQSPPARFSNTTARTIWMSSQPWLPATGIAFEKGLTKALGLAARWADGFYLRACESKHLEARGEHFIAGGRKWTIREAGTRLCTPFTNC
jgi:hypothetical protein